MREELYRAYDIIIENQRNADNKAYIFIVIISAFLTFFDKIPLNMFDENQQESLSYFFFITILPLLFFILSLIPIYNDTFKTNHKEKTTNNLNIFFWKSITYSKSKIDFLSDYISKYGQHKVDEFEKDFLNQIYVNANILENKKKLHAIAFQFIIQFLILLGFSILYYIIFKENLIISLIVLVLFELIYIFKAKILILYNKIKYYKK